MSRKPLVILGSARKESDTRKLVETIFKGVDHSLVDLLDLEINYYSYEHQYPEVDDYSKLVDEFLKHQVIVFATPVYWYSMSSPMKTLFDRFSDLITHNKKVGRLLKGKNILLIAVGAEEILPDGFEVPFKCTAEYLDMKYLGSIYHSTQTARPNAQAIDDFKRKLFEE